MSFKTTSVLFFFLFFCSKIICQTPDNKQIIANKLNDYFALERENIHLHLSKDTYLSDENIWFKGYAYNRKELIPFFSTTNVFVVLYNQTGKKINQQLAYTNTGTFEGNFNDLNDLPSGNYYIQVYTNWMNNFQEDESTIYPIKIINSKKPDFFDTTKTDLASARIEINPEGGNLIIGVTNIVGVKITDKFNNPIGNVTVVLKNSTNEIISEVIINSEGMGKFFINPKNDVHSLSFNLNDKVIIQQLPSPTIKGIAIEANSYVIPNKASVKIKTNALTFNDLKSKKLFLVVQQDERALIFDVMIDPNTFEQKLIFATDNIATGTNTIRIIDDNMNQLAERTIFKLSDPSQTLTLSKNLDKNGYTKIQGTSSQNSANLSVSVVPATSTATEKCATITSDFLYNCYLLQPIKKLTYYTSNATIAKKYQLDLEMLNQKSKYAWNEIVQNPPVLQHEFDMGLTIKGKLMSPALNNVNDYNIRFRSMHHLISVQSPISKSTEFEFKNLILSDSTAVDFGLFKNTDAKPINFTYTAKIVNGNRTFKFPFKGLNEVDLNQPFNSIIEELPKFSDDIIQLSVVEIEAKKNALKRSNNLENANLRGFKIPDIMTMNVLTYIGTNGFNVSENGGSVNITARGGGSINAAQASPMVYVDNVQIFDFAYFLNMQMEELEEIYMNPTVLVSSVRNNQGMIRMYRKAAKSKAGTSNLKYMDLLSGFTKPAKFKSSNYKSTSDAGFLNYGLINWVPSILTDEKNNFEIDIPNYNQKKIKVIFEGFTFDGKLISETQFIDL